jgi:uncharacterized phage protein (TIGR02218 family)
MKTVSSDLRDHLSGGQTTVAYLWKVKRLDGTILGFTNHDRDISFDDGRGDGSVIYKASTGFANSAASSKSDLSVDNLEAVGFLDSSAITENDLRANLYDDSDIIVYLVNWNDLSMGAMVVRRGTLGIVKLVNGKFTAELRGLTHKLTTQVGATIGPVCRAEFGSGLNGIDMNSKYLCRVDVTAYQQTGSIETPIDPSGFMPNPGLKMVGTATPDVEPPDGWFNDGFITFTSGNNSGFSFEIKSWVQTPIMRLFLPVPYPMAPGDTFIIEPGCNKTTGDCTNKFNNIVNFRGEPFIPGMDRFLTGIGGGSGIG